MFRPPTTIIDYLLQSILMLAMLRYIDWDKFTERKKLRKFVNAHLSVSGTVPKTQWGTPFRLVSLDCLRQYFFEIFFNVFFLILASERCHIFVIYLLRKSHFFVLKKRNV